MSIPWMEIVAELFTSNQTIKAALTDAQKRAFVGATRA